MCHLDQHPTPHNSSQHLPKKVLIRQLTHFGPLVQLHVCPSCIECSQRAKISYLSSGTKTYWKIKPLVSFIFGKKSGNLILDWSRLWHHARDTTWVAEPPSFLIINRGLRKCPACRGSFCFDAVSIFAGDHENWNAGRGPIGCCWVKMRPLIPRAFPDALYRTGIKHGGVAEMRYATPNSLSFTAEICIYVYIYIWE